jgi:hypothetical protein
LSLVGVKLHEIIKFEKQLQVQLEEQGLK